MTKATELMKEVGSKLKSDIESDVKNIPEGNLYYLLSTRIQLACMQALEEAGIDDFETSLVTSSKVSKEFLHSLIDYSSKND